MKNNNMNFDVTSCFSFCYSNLKVRTHSQI